MWRAALRFFPKKRIVACLSFLIICVLMASMYKIVHTTDPRLPPPNVRDPSVHPEPFRHIDDDKDARSAYFDHIKEILQRGDEKRDPNMNEFGVWEMHEEPKEKIDENNDEMSHMMQKEQYVTKAPDVQTTISNVNRPKIIIDLDKVHLGQPSDSMILNNRQSAVKPAPMPLKSIKKHEHVDLKMVKIPNGGGGEPNPVTGLSGNSRKELDREMVKHVRDRISHILEKLNHYDNRPEDAEKQEQLLQKLASEVEKINLNKMHDNEPANRNDDDGRTDRQNKWQKTSTRVEQNLISSANPSVKAPSYRQDAKNVPQQVHDNRQQPIMGRGDLNGDVAPQTEKTSKLYNADNKREQDVSVYNKELEYQRLKTNKIEFPATQRNVPVRIKTQETEQRQRSDNVRHAAQMTDHPQQTDSHLPSGQSNQKPSFVQTKKPNPWGRAFDMIQTFEMKQKQQEEANVEEVNSVASKPDRLEEVDQVDNDNRSGTSRRNESRENIDEVDVHDDDREDEKAIIAATLKSKPKIVCWVKTSPSTLYTRGLAIKRTWGRRCNVLLFMSSVADPKFPSVGLNVSEGREYLTEKTMKAFKYVYRHHFLDGDWFLATDDDTFVVMENLRHFLSDKDPIEPLYYGHVFKQFTTQGYTSGGAGYVLSREALRKLATTGSDRNVCEQDGGDGVDDVHVGECLERIGVKLGDSRDSKGRARFNCFTPEDHVMGNYPDWYFAYDAYGAKKNFISDHAITFHYVSPEFIYTLNYLLYHLRPKEPPKPKEGSTKVTRMHESVRKLIKS